ncbi:MAG: hypothetical protein C3F02_02260 [Parcubacteria group bacterium]|nr:MAG: hypothetical protein C3F02_02260 [Parcubacteria group bacterium]
MQTPSNPNIKDLLAASRQGNEEAFYGFYQILHQPLFRFLLSRSKTREDAQDILQELFIDLWRASGRFNYHSDAQFYGFVYRIARRKLSRHYQEKPAAQWQDGNIRDSYEFIPEDFGQIRKVLNLLDEKYRLVIELRYWSQLTLKEIAAVLEITENNVKIRHYRALKKMEELLKKHDK